MDSSHSKMLCASLGTGMFFTKPYLGTILKQIDLVSFFFPSYGSLRHCLHYLNIEDCKWLKTSKGNGFLGACGWFCFRRPPQQLDDFWLERAILKVCSLEYAFANCLLFPAVLCRGSSWFIWKDMRELACCQDISYSTKCIKTTFFSEVE